MPPLDLAALIAAKKAAQQAAQQATVQPAAQQAAQQATVQPAATAQPAQQANLTPLQKIMLAKQAAQAAQSVHSAQPAESTQSQPQNTKPVQPTKSVQPLQSANLMERLRNVTNNSSPATNNTVNTNISNKLSSNSLTATSSDKVPTSSESSIKDNSESSTSITDTRANQNSPTGMHGELITYNREQEQAVNLGANLNSFVLIGAAGTGKTTCSQGVISSLIASGKIPVLQSDGHKHLRDGALGILIIAFTRRAVNNSRKVQSEDFKHNCITAHKLLEYAPEYYEIEDPETGISRRTMSFEPTRNAINPISPSVHTIIIEEASMLSVELFKQIQQACPHPVQWIFIGDLEQLPPVFGSAILGFALLELPVVQLTQVYRQALESPIIRLAHRILSGVPIPESEFPEWNVQGKLKIHPWKKKLHPDLAVATLAAFFKAAIDKNEYDPEEDTILIPYNKACGTIELNANIANHLARKRGAVTFEIVAGFQKHYYSVGDKVLYDKEDAEILDIEVNTHYTGTPAQPSSVHLDYWGHNPNLAKERVSSSSTALDSLDVDMLLNDLASESQEDRVTKASHIVTVRLLDSDSTRTLDKASEINAMMHSYALTVHKSQGSEWRKVFFCLHQSHATMLQRELLYTGVTRAREELYIICEPESLTKGITSQRIKGDTLEEKAEHFKGKTSGYIGNIFPKNTNK